jgi:hypothetical protein
VETDKVTENGTGDVICIGTDGTENFQSDVGVNPTF